MTRAVQNLVGNAARHGSRVLLTVRLTAKWLAFVVEDDGPGIPEADRARAMQPFTRLEAARTQAEGGASVGLGLSIALDVARSHGGSLELGESADLGGLRATLRGFRGRRLPQPAVRGEIAREPPGWAMRGKPLKRLRFPGLESGWKVAGIRLATF